MKTPRAQDSNGPGYGATALATGTNAPFAPRPARPSREWPSRNPLEVEHGRSRVRLRESRKTVAPAAASRARRRRQDGALRRDLDQSERSASARAACPVRVWRRTTKAGTSPTASPRSLLPGCGSFKLLTWFAIALLPLGTRSRRCARSRANMP